MRLAFWGTWSKVLFCAYHMLALCLVGLVLITAVNLWGIAESAPA